MIPMLRIGTLTALSLLTLHHATAYGYQEEEPCTDDTCCLKIVEKKDGKTKKVVQRGKSIMGTDPASKKKRAAVSAGIAMVRVGEVACGVNYPGEGDAPAADDLKGGLERGDVCEVDENDSENKGTGTSNVQQDVSGDNGVNVTNFDGINLAGGSIPKGYASKEQAQADILDEHGIENATVIEFGGEWYSLNFLVAFAGNLVHELVHRDDTTSQNDIEREDKATAAQIDFLCKMCSCSALFDGDPPPQSFKDAMCAMISALNEARCKKWKLPPVACPCCEDANPPEPCPDSEGQEEGSGGGQVFLLEYPGEFLTEDLYLDRHFGTISLNRSDRRLTWSLIHKVTGTLIEVVADWTEPTAFRDNFYPTAFCMLQDDIAIVTGVDGFTGEGVVLAVTLNIIDYKTAALNERPIYAGFGFSNIIAVDSVDNAAAIVMLDTLADQVIWMDLRTSGLSVLADSSDDPRIGTAKYLHAGRHYLPGRDMWVGLSVSVADIPIKYTAVVGPRSFFKYLIADTNGDGLIDTKLVLAPD